MDNSISEIKWSEILDFNLFLLLNELHQLVEFVILIIFRLSWDKQFFSRQFGRLPPAECRHGLPMQIEFLEVLDKAFVSN